MRGAGRRYYIMTHAQKALKLFDGGCNCAQALVAAFAEDMGMDVDTACRLSASFGGGVGRMHDLCGAVSGMCMVLGALYGFGSTVTEEDKVAYYEQVRRLVDGFKDKYGSYICRELLVSDEPHDHAWFRLNYCVHFVAFAADLLDEYIASHPVLR